MVVNVEGTDNSNKKALTKLLYSYLTSVGKSCKLVAFPNYQNASSTILKMYQQGEFGDENNLNRYQRCVLYAMDRSLTLNSININDYDFVIFDGYTTTNMICQSYGITSKRELDKFLLWVEDFEYNKLALPKPNLTIFLDVPIEFNLNYATQQAGGKDAINLLKEELIKREEYDRIKYVAHKLEWKTVRCVQNGKMLPDDLILEKIKRIIQNDY